MVCFSMREKSPINLFIIPSWYPSPINPISGIFFQEQAEAIVAVYPEVTVIISTWGHDSHYLSFKKPWTFCSCIIRRIIASKKKWNQLRNGVHEIFQPSFSWSGRQGGKHLVEVNRKNLKEAIKRFGKIDVIHAQVSFPAGYIAAVLSKEFDIPFVFTEHMGPFPFPSFLNSNKRPIPEIDLAFQDAKKVVAVSPFLADEITSYGYHRPIVIPNIVDEQRYLPTPPSEKKFTFLSLCNLDKKKGIDILLQGIALWMPDESHIKFWIAGDGNEEKTLRELAQQLGVEKYVQWLGHADRDKTPSLFKKCHAFVLPSRCETFGVAYAEAIACGKPVIATRCGGPESIVNNSNGILVPKNDPKALALAMENMFEDWDNYSPQTIRKTFEKRFSRPVVAEQLVEIYKEVIASFP